MISIFQHPFVLKLRAKTCPFFDRFIPVNDTDLLKVKDFRSALNSGTTLTTRFWISLFSIMLGAQLLTGNPSMFSPAGYAAMFELVPIPVWAATLLVSGAAMLWRVLAWRPRPAVAWCSNFLTCFVWTMIVISRFFVAGSQSLISTSTVIMLMSAWVLLRTEATYRDGETT